MHGWLSQLNLLENPYGKYVNCPTFLCCEKNWILTISSLITRALNRLSACLLIKNKKLYREEIYRLTLNLTVGVAADKGDIAVLPVVALLLDHVARWMRGNKSFPILVTFLYSKPSAWPSQWTPFNCSSIDGIGQSIWPWLVDAANQLFLKVA